MNKTLAFVVLVACGAGPSWPCSCRAARPACAYLSSDAIFLGRVSFTNDDGSGSFAQTTLVRFDVEEIFKGLSPETKQVWVDPGSLTSCYEEYELGERYLIFAQRQDRMPLDSASITLTTANFQRKPLPPGFDPARPPEVYSAPECSGSRLADSFPHIEVDLAALRAYRSGQPPPRVLGWAFLEPFHPWPLLDGPALRGVRIRLSDGTTTLTTTTAADGSFSLAEAPAGVYNLEAEMPPLVPVGSPYGLVVPDAGCGSRDIALRTSSELAGAVVNQRGQPVAGVPVELTVLSTIATMLPATMSTESDAKGRFAIVGVPEADLRLSYGSAHPSSGMAPYPLVYYPDAAGPSKAGTLKVSVGEHRSDLVLRLPPPPPVSSVKVKVVTEEGRPVSGAPINGFLDEVITESARSGADGSADLPCLSGLRYQLRVSVPYRRASTSKATDLSPAAITCGRDKGPVVLVFQHPVN